MMSCVPVRCVVCCRAPPAQSRAISRFDAAAYGSLAPVVAPKVAAVSAAALCGSRGGQRMGDQSSSSGGGDGEIERPPPPCRNEVSELRPPLYGCVYS